MALCIPVTTINGKTAAKIPVATQPKWAYSQMIAAEKIVPTSKPNGPKINKATGTVITKLIIGTKKIRIGFGEIRVNSFSI